MKNYIKVHKDDNVAVALIDLEPGTIINQGSNAIILKDFIKQKHKFTLGHLKKGDLLIMYGFVVGQVQKICYRGVLFQHQIRNIARLKWIKQGLSEMECPGCFSI